MDQVELMVSDGVRDPGRSLPSDRRPSLSRWARVELAEPPPPREAGSGASPPARPVLRRLRSSWRPWMVIPACLLLLSVAAVAPGPGDAVWSDDVVNARSVIAVDVPDDRTSEATGDYWAPRQTRTTSLLDWIVTLAPGGAAPAELSADRVDGLDPLQTAVLLGAGVARGRDNAVELGYATRRLSDALPPSSLAVALWAYDAAGDVDLSAGRQILALGTLRGDGSIGCPTRSVASTAGSMPTSPDVIVIGDCADARVDAASSTQVVEVSTLEDAVLELARSAQPTTGNR